MSLAKRVARRYLKAEVFPNIRDYPKWIDMQCQGLKNNVVLLAGIADTLEALIHAGEARRLGRTDDVKIASAKGNARQITAIVQGTSGRYDTRITLSPKRGHHCTCPDWQKRGKQVGPCKHVLALARYWRETEVIPALDNLAEGVGAVLKDFNKGLRVFG